MAGLAGRTRRLIVAALLAAGFAVLGGATGATAAQASTTWLCFPGATFNPCLGSLQTTVISSSGSGAIQDVPVATRPQVDCFYVYPTVSEDPGTNSDLSIDPEEAAIAHYQASRFSQQCRVFAPMYRQLTLNAINGASGVSTDALLTAYGDVRDAWREYWKHYNHGRPVVLIGHSQGAGMLTQLVREQIDPYRKARRQLLSAQLIGGNVTVKIGSDVGGVFNTVPACRAATQRSCVVAYSSYNAVPPDDTVFGKPSGALVDAFGQGGRTDLQVLCVNPAALAGGSAPLHTLVPTDPFPGTIGFGVAALFQGKPPTANTPWVEPKDHYIGECQISNGASVLMISPIGSARQLFPVPDATWGLHLADVNLALGNLVDLVGTETGSYLKHRAKLRQRAKTQLGKKRRHRARQRHRA